MLATVEGESIASLVPSAVRVWCTGDRGAVPYSFSPWVGSSLTYITVERDQSYNTYEYTYTYQ